MDYYGRVKQMVRKTKRISLQEFIYSLGMNPDSYYSLKKAGNLPRADEALKIAQALGTSIEYLMTGIEPENTVKDFIADIRAVIDRYSQPPASKRAGGKA